MLVSAIPNFIPREKLIYGLNYLFTCGGEGNENTSFSLAVADIDRFGAK